MRILVQHCAALPLLLPRYHPPDCASLATVPGNSASPVGEWFFQPSLPLRLAGMFHIYGFTTVPFPKAEKQTWASHQWICWCTGPALNLGGYLAEIPSSHGLSYLALHWHPKFTTLAMWTSWGHHFPASSQVADCTVPPGTLPSHLSYCHMMTFHAHSDICLRRRFCSWS